MNQKAIPSYAQDPDAKLDYKWDWTDWLDVGETITSQTVTATTGGAITNVTQVTGVVTAWHETPTVSGLLTCHVVTSVGRFDDRSFYIQVMQR